MADHDGWQVVRQLEQHELKRSSSLCTLARTSLCTWGRTPTAARPTTR